MVRRLVSAGAAVLLVALSAGAQVPVAPAKPAQPSKPAEPAKPAELPKPAPPVPFKVRPPGVTPPPAPTAAPAAPTPAPDRIEKARQGVVVLERAGKAIALGAVLDGDGRILTALSALGNGNFISARYHDGRIVQVKLAHSDRAWDLALLQPQTPPPLRKLGLRASRQPSFVSLQTFALAPPNTITAAPMSLKLSAPLLGGDSVSLTGAYELGNKVAYVGGPVVSYIGEVVALVARACPPGSGAACTPAPYGVPVGALKQFLQKVPAEATWLGIEGVGDESNGVRGVRVVALAADSPAASAGLRPGKDAAQADLVVAVDGLPVASPSELNEAVRAHALGDDIELLLYGMGRYRHVTVKPRPAPQLVKPPVATPKPPKPRIPNPYR